MIKNALSFGLAGCLSLSVSGSVLAETSSKKGNSSIDSKIERLYRSTEFGNEDLPLCPHPYKIKKDRKPSEVKILESKGGRYDACVTDKYIYVKTSFEKRQCIVIGKISREERLHYNLRVYDYSSARNLMVFSEERME